MGNTGLCRQVEEKVRRAISAGPMWSPGETVVVAVSGGADSLCLLHVLWTLQPEHGARLHVAHLDHRFRGEESAAEARMVAGLARQWGLASTVEAVDVPARMAQEGLSAEEAARRARYRFLSGVAGRLGAAAIALGHTADDQVETVLAHLLRGSGPMGLRGMRTISPPAPWMVEGLALKTPLRLVRPLLEVTRAETEGYCAAVGLEPVCDPWNEDRRFLRVRLRKEVLPLLETLNPQVRQALLRLARLAAWEEEDLEGMLDAHWPALASEMEGVVRLDLVRLQGLPRTLRLLALRRAVGRVRGDLADLGWEAVVAAAGLLSAKVGSQVALVGPLVARREYTALAVGREADLDAVTIWPELGSAQVPLAVPGHTALGGGFAVVADVLPVGEVDPGAAGRFEAYVDAGRAGRRLWLRTRRPGDRFQPLGMAGRKTLQDFFVDEKVPRAERARVPLVVAPRGIVWVVGYRLSEHFRVTETSRQVLHLRWVREQEAESKPV